jgi:transcriptional regulator with XRE-family HTH domain
MSRRVTSATYADAADILEELPAAVRVTRRQRGLSLREVGEILDLSPSTMSRIESGQSVSAVQAVIRVLRWLDDRPRK